MTCHILATVYMPGLMGPADNDCLLSQAASPLLCTHVEQQNNKLPQELQLKKQALQSKFPEAWKLTGSPGAEERQKAGQESQLAPASHPDTDSLCSTLEQKD